MRIFATIAILGFFLVSVSRSNATPFFARTYHLKCNTCHSGFPRLNEYGMAFKANNFRIPGDEKKAPLAWQKTIPLAMQIMPVHQRFSPGAGQSEYTDSQILAGGLLTRTTAFYVHDSLWIDDRPTSFPSYEVWIQQILDEKSKLMAKVGQFELPYSYSPNIHLVSSFQPLLFGVGLSNNDVRLGSAMRGIQLSGIADNRVRWALAYGAPAVNTPGNSVGNRSFFGDFRDFFLRVSNANQPRSIGMFLYLSNPPLNVLQPAAANRGLRIGIDGAYIWKGWQFSAMAAYGENNDPLGNGTKGTFRTGFIEADKMLLPWLGINGRLEAQTVGEAGKIFYSDAKTIGLCLYPVSRIRLTAEYQQADHGASATALFASLTF